MTIHHHPFVRPARTDVGARPRIRRLVSLAAVAAAAAVLGACSAEDAPIVSAAAAVDEPAAQNSTPEEPEVAPEGDVDAPLPATLRGTMTLPGYYLPSANRMRVDAQLREADGEVLGTLEITTMEGQDMPTTPMTTTGVVPVTGTRNGGRLRLELADFADHAKCQYTGIVVELVTTDGVRWNQDTVDGTVTCPDGEVEGPILRSFRLVAG